MTEGITPQMVVSTSVVALISGFLLGVYAIRGYVISPALKQEREAKWKDPVESEESDIDENDTILDHAPNWTNGEEADRRQGLRATATANAAANTPAKAPKSNEECKLVLVVRTDLGMTKGMSPFPLFCLSPLTPWQVKSQLNADTQPLHATRPFPGQQQKTLCPPRRSCCANGSGSDRPRLPCRSRARMRCWS